MQRSRDRDSETKTIITQKFLRHVIWHQQVINRTGKAIFAFFTSIWVGFLILIKRTAPIAANMIHIKRHLDLLF